MKIDENKKNNVKIIIYGICKEILELNLFAVCSRECWGFLHFSYNVRLNFINLPLSRD